MHLRQKHSPLVLLLCALRLAPVLPNATYAAAETNLLAREPQVLVTATRLERSAMNTPNYADIVSQIDIRIDNASETVPDALRNQTATMIQKTSHGQGSPYLRGFTGFRNLFLIDGIRLNNSVFRDGPNQYWNTVDPLTVDRIEVIKGPFSSLYGSDAVGGTVKAVTAGRADFPDGLNVNERVYYRYSSAAHATAARLEISGNSGDEIGVLGGYTVRGFGDLIGGKAVGKQPRTGYSERNWDLKLDYFPTPDSTIALVHQSVKQDDVWRTHKTIYGISWEGTTVGNEKRRSLDQERDFTYLQYQKCNIDSFFDELRTGISRHRQEEEQYRIKADDSSDRSGFDVATMGGFAQLKSPSSIGTLVYGFEYYHDTVDSFSLKYSTDGSFKSREIQGPVADGATYDLLGFFVQDDIPFTERMNLILGGRYDRARVDADSVLDPVSGDTMSLSDDWRSIVGNARLFWSLDDMNCWSLFAGAAQGFRAPNLSDLTRLDTARSNEIETPSPDLKPERFLSWEAGMKGSRESVTLQLGCFYTDIDGMIVRTPTGQIIDGDNEVTKKNSGNGYVYGAEMEARIKVLSQWTLFGGFTWLDGRIETYPTSEPLLVEEPIERLMPPAGRIGLKWNIPGGFWIEGSCRFADKADRLSTRDAEDTQRIPPGGTPGYAVYDIRAGWKQGNHLALSAAIENLTDEDYRIHGSGINEPGRNFVLAADCTF
jgi:hemoglobin/transferrin/lactoferrin receptor protein